MMLMEAHRCDPAFRRPWTMLAAALTAAHHGFELSSGIGLVGQPELGLVGAGTLWATQIPVWIAVAAKGDKRWDRLLAVWSGAALGGAVVHFLIWPWRRSSLGIPVLAEAEGLGVSKLPAYNTLLYGWGAASALSIALECLRVSGDGPSWVWRRCLSCAVRPSTIFRGSSIRRRRDQPGGIGASKPADAPLSRPVPLKSTASLDTT